MTSSTNTYNLLRLVRNLRTGSLPHLRLQEELRVIHERREAAAAVDSTLTVQPGPGAPATTTVCLKIQ